MFDIGKAIGGITRKEGVNGATCLAGVTEGFSQKAEVAVPEKLVGENGKVGVEKDFQTGSFGLKGK